MSSNLHGHLTVLPDDSARPLSTALGCLFEYATVNCGQYALPTDLPQKLIFKPAIVPGTITQLIANEADAHALPLKKLEQLEQLDQKDHWLKTQFSVNLTANFHYFLQFSGLLTHADIYLNNRLICQSRNAFHTQTVDVSALLLSNNQLHICFRAIAPILSTKQARARFPTRLINQRHLRFIRTPTLGYMPGFASEAKLVGAFRAITLISQQQLVVQSARINTALISHNQGNLSANLDIKYFDSIALSAHFVLIDELSQVTVAQKAADIQVLDDMMVFNTSLNADHIEAYWPHTHGTPKRYLLKLLVINADKQQEILLGRHGFRSIHYADNFALNFNQQALFLRGACWTPMHPLSLQTSTAQLQQRLHMLQQAGINILRLPGNMPYECDEFYEMCDALGILIMQDFAFCNFDYPIDDAEFIASVQQEAESFLAKHAHRACLTLLAGNSEVAQQAAMMGIAIDSIHHIIFDDVIKNICAQYAPNVPYVSSSPSSNAQSMPFHTGNGTSHYYGVGGYKRNYEDARLFKGQFIAECLAFSHVPENASLLTFYDNALIPPHHPRWKAGVPRDNGAGWDFADISDFYVAQLFGINVVQLRATHPTRYLDYCRAMSCDIVERTLNILRANAQQGRVAIVWLLHDLKPGAGWGYIDSLGVPKSAFYGLARASQTTTCLFVDEGLEGLALYVAHDGADHQVCQLEIALIAADGSIVQKQIKPYQLTGRATQRVSIDAFLGRFVDSSYAYRFGPRSFVACVAKLTDLQGNVISQKVFIEPELTQLMATKTNIVASCHLQNSGDYLLNLSATQPVYFAVIDVPNVILSDNYLHIMPGYDVQITVKTNQKPVGRVRAFNSTNSIAITHI